MNNYVIMVGQGGIYQLSQVPGYSQSLPYSGGYIQNTIPEIDTDSYGWERVGTNDDRLYGGPATDLEDSISDNFSVQKGKHFLQAGFIQLWGTKRQSVIIGSATNGDFTINGYATNCSSGATWGSAQACPTSANQSSANSTFIADALLGAAFAFTQSDNDVRKYLHYPIFSPYFSDEWKATRRLVITAGVRYFYMPWPTEQAGYAVIFNPALYNPALAPTVATNGVLSGGTGNLYEYKNGLEENGENSVPLNLTNANNNHFAPTVGFAWDVFGDGKTSLRGGYGMSYNKAVGQGCAQGCVAYPAATQTSLSFVQWPNPTGGLTPPPSAGSESAEDVQHYVAQRIQTYSLSLQHQFGADWFVQVAGAGNVYSHGLLSLNINQSVPYFGTNSVSSVPEGLDFNPTLNTGTNSAYNAPYQGYSSIGDEVASGIENWNALELSVKHPVGHNLYLTAAYTWSHNLSTGGIQNNYKLWLDYGNSSSNTPQVFTFSAIYSLPLFSSGWKQSVLGGRKISDMTTLQSGSSLSPTLGTADSGLATRPDQLAKVRYPGHNGLEARYLNRRQWCVVQQHRQRRLLKHRPVHTFELYDRPKSSLTRDRLFRRRRKRHDSWAGSRSLQRLSL